MGTIYHVGADSRVFEDAYAEPLAERELPRYRMPQEKSDPQTVRNLIRDELNLDGNAAQNVATFCTTYDDDDVRYLMDMSVNKNLIDKDEYPQSADIENRCDENTMGVITTLGVTFTGIYEPVHEIAAALDDLQARTGLDIPIHVDAASGGFIAPFLQPALEWDFRIPRVTSINASGHKYGLAPLGVGWVVWRETADLPEDLVFRVDYLGGELPTFALNFSRPAGQVIAQYYLLLRHGHAGYRDIHRACADHARYLAGRLPKTGPFQLLYDGQGALPAVCYKLADESAPFTLYDLSDRLRVRGGRSPPTHFPRTGRTRPSSGSSSGMGSAGKWRDFWSGTSSTASPL